ncbi:MAG: MATE family efflux transporter, partial [Lachnospiraceae bacterium]|nr:MATE family efflux transporter [Candidatus Equihabitans merdae]
ITNQLLFVFTLGIFGALAGAGIYCSQYYGKGDMKKVQTVFRYKLWIAIVLTAASIALYWLCRYPLINLFLTDTGNGMDINATLGYGVEYLRIMLIGLVPFAAGQIYATTMRETDETRIPMVAGAAAVLTNLVLNYILIFGHLGAPRMGVAGAAWATVISRFVEFGILMVYATVAHAKLPYFKGIYRTLMVPADLFKAITIKSIPLLFNELLWSVGMTVLAQCYSTRGLDAVAAYNICSTVSNFFSMMTFSMGTTIAIMVGQELGAGRFEQAIDFDRKLIVIGVIMGVVVTIFLGGAAFVFPLIYNTTEEVKHLATGLLIFDALFLTARGLYNNAYFTLRSGGKTFITFLFDSGSMWAILIPTTFLLTRLTAMTLIQIYITVQFLDGIKGVVGVWLVKKRIWVNNLTV